MNQESVLDLTIYLNELLRTIQPEQLLVSDDLIQRLGKNEEHTPIQTGILTEVYELREQKKLITNGTKFFEQFDWTNTRLTKVEKQATIITTTTKTVTDLKESQKLFTLLV